MYHYLFNIFSFFIHTVYVILVYVGEASSQLCLRVFFGCSVPLSNREEVKTSTDTFVLECPQGGGPQIGDQDAPMQHVGEIGSMYILYLGLFISYFHGVTKFYLVILEDRLFNAI